MLVPNRLAHGETTEVIIGAAFEVYNTLGSGFLEKVYENTLVAELEERGLKVEQQKNITVIYKGRIVGEYIADLIVEGVVMIELKTVDCLVKAHEAQLLNYLEATGTKVGMLFNFHGPSLS